MDQKKDAGKSDSYVMIGKVHSAQGIRGDLYISIFAEEANWAEQWDRLYCSKKNEDKPQQSFKIIKKRQHQKQKRWGFVVSVEGVADRNQSEAMVGSNVYIPEHFLVSGEGEDLYLREVLGFRVLDQQRGDVGEVVGFSGNSMQDILVIKNDIGEYEVPFVSPIHLQTDKEKQQLLMDIPQGLVAGEEL